MRPEQIATPGRAVLRAPFVIGAIWGLATAFSLRFASYANLLNGLALGGALIWTTSLWPRESVRANAQPIVVGLCFYASVALLSGFITNASIPAMIRSVLIVPTMLAIMTIVLSGTAERRLLVNGIAMASLVSVTYHVSYLDWGKLPDPHYRFYLFSNPNAVAFVAAMAAIVALHWILSAKSWGLRVIYLFLWGAGLILLFSTKSRTAAAVSISGQAVLVLQRIKLGRLGSAILVTAAVLSVVVLMQSAYVTELSGSMAETYSLNDSHRGLSHGTGRFRIWRFAWKELVVPNLLLGVGPDNYRDALLKGTGMRNVHNGLLRSLLDAGLVGTSVLLLIVYAGLRGAIRNWRSEAYDLEIAIMTAGLLESTAEVTFFSFGNPGSLLFMVAVGSLCMYSRNLRDGVE